MTNTDKLQGKMREKKMSLSNLAKILGLSTTGLFNKVHNKQEFRVSEVREIGIALGLNESELQEIFFAV